MFSLKSKFFFLILLVGAGLGTSGYAYADSVDFFVDPAYDPEGRIQLSASSHYQGENARWYIADQYWISLSSIQKLSLIKDVKNLSTKFDDVIYPRLRDLFGSENKPGIDNDPKITILITRMRSDAGGYFREKDGFPKSQIEGSNGREMIYLNSLYADNSRAPAFLAHELQHLITFNRKTIKHDIVEEIWLNELRSEIASTLLGYDDPDVYEGSNLEARVGVFLRTPSDAILEWENEAKDYGTINLFGQYILDHYGRSLIASMIQNDKIGIESFNEALNTFGFQEDFAGVFTNWTIANLVNDCSIEPLNVYCYSNPNLDYDTLHIGFDILQDSGETISSQTETKEWQADWLKLAKELEAEKPKDHVFKLEFTSVESSNFKVPYVVYDKDGGILEIKEMSLEGGGGIFYVENFAFIVPQVVIMPLNQPKTKSTSLDSPITPYSFIASTVEEIPFGDISTTGDFADLTDLPEGSLIRADNDRRVYIIQGGYKRWVQSAEIFNFYGHLDFDAVQVVSPETLALYKDSWLVRAAGETKVYEINGDGTRHWLDISAEELPATGRFWDMVYVINKTELEWYKEGPSIK